MENRLLQNDNCNIVFESAITDWSEFNSSFDKGVLRIAYHGANRNGTFISKNAFNDAARTMFNCPVVCNYQRDTDSIGSHDVDVVEKDGKVRIVNVTTPVGIVPESANVWWSEVTEDDGKTHEYLCTEILIWKRQEAYEHIKENGIVDESMEIKILSGGRQDDGLYHIDKFEFLAFCLLESAPPCFESAGIELFSLNDFRAEYARMMEDIKQEFAIVNTASADDIPQSCSKGGTCDLDVNELMKKYSISAEDVTFDTTGMQLDEIERKFAEIKASKDSATVPEEEGVEEPENAGENGSENDNAGAAADSENEGESGEDDQSYSLTAGQFMDELYDALSSVRYTDPYWGECCKYWYMDYDPSLMEVYAFDAEDWKLYGMPYGMNGDKVVIDFAKCKRKKTCYVDFDEGDAAFSENKAFSNLIPELREKFKALNEAVNALKEFKQEVESNNRKAAADEVFAKFADLDSNEEFKALQSGYGKMTAEQIEEKCFAIRGRSMAANFSLENSHKSIRLPIESQATKDADEPYGGIFVKYGIGK